MMKLQIQKCNYDIHEHYLWLEDIRIDHIYYDFFELEDNGGSE